MAFLFPQLSLARRGHGLGGRCDLCYFTGDVRLAHLVVRQRQALNEIIRVVRRIAHGHHLGAEEACRGLQDGLVDQHLDYIFEPDPQSILEQLLPRYIEVQIYQAVLETAASFFSSQMVAMRNATDNANDLVDSLSLTYNKVRQANITREVTEIASAAEAMAAASKR